MSTNRTTATCFFGKTDAFAELDKLKFAVSALAAGFPNGSHEHEMAQNACRGIRERLDYLHDSFRLLLEHKP